MDSESQTQIKRIVKDIGKENILVVLGASDIEGVELMAEMQYHKYISPTFYPKRQ